jgi:hypothetical protein
MAKNPDCANGRIPDLRRVLAYVPNRQTAAPKKTPSSNALNRAAFAGSLFFISVSSADAVGWVRPVGCRCPLNSCGARATWTKARAGETFVSVACQERKTPEHATRAVRASTSKIGRLLVMVPSLRSPGATSEKNRDPPRFMPQDSLQ